MTAENVWDRQGRWYNDGKINVNFTTSYMDYELTSSVGQKLQHLYYCPLHVSNRSTRSTSYTQGLLSFQVISQRHPKHMCSE